MALRRSEDGRSIYIKDAFGLANQVLPQFFKHNNLRSMLRQLNAYGFKRTEEHVAAGRLEYSHEYFREGRRDLLSQIPRIGTQVGLAEAASWRAVCGGCELRGSRRDATRCVPVRAHGVAPQARAPISGSAAMRAVPDASSI